jgi:hypothetical protein
MGGPLALAARPPLDSTKKPQVRAMSHARSQEDDASAFGGKTVVKYGAGFVGIEQSALMKVEAPTVITLLRHPGGRTTTAPALAEAPARVKR